MMDNVSNVWDSKASRRVVCEEYYSVMCATKTDAEIRKIWRDLGVNSSTCYGYLRRFNLKQSHKNWNKSFQLNQRIIKDFCAKHYHLMSPSSSDEDIKEQWLKWGVSEKNCVKFLENFKENNGWKKNLLSGKLDIFAIRTKKKPVLIRTDEKKICEEIFRRRNPRISHSEIRKVFESLGVPLSKTYVYMKEFKKLASSGELSGKSSTQSLDNDDGKSIASNKTRKSILDRNEDSQSASSVSSPSLLTPGAPREQFEVVGDDIPVESYKNLNIINGYLRKFGHKQKKFNR